MNPKPKTLRQAWAYHCSEASSYPVLANAMHRAFADIGHPLVGNTEPLAGIEPLTEIRLHLDYAKTWTRLTFVFAPEIWRELRLGDYTLTLLPELQGTPLTEITTRLAASLIHSLRRHGPPDPDHGNALFHCQDVHARTPGTYLRACTWNRELGIVNSDAGTLQALPDHHYIQSIDFTVRYLVR